MGLAHASMQNAQIRPALFIICIFFDAVWLAARARQSTRSPVTHNGAAGDVGCRTPARAPSARGCRGRLGEACRARRARGRRRRRVAGIPGFSSRLDKFRARVGEADVDEAPAAALRRPRSDEPRYLI
jgi:hypothetical protein